MPITKLELDAVLSRVDETIRPRVIASASKGNVGWTAQDLTVSSASWMSTAWAGRMVAAWLELMLAGWLAGRNDGWVP